MEWSTGNDLTSRFPTLKLSLGRAALISRAEGELCQNLVASGESSAPSLKQNCRWIKGYPLWDVKYPSLSSRGER
jgi:hypothetical protein